MFIKCFKIFHYVSIRFSFNADEFGEILTIYFILQYLFLDSNAEENSKTVYGALNILPWMRPWGFVLMCYTMGQRKANVDSVGAGVVWARGQNGDGIALGEGEGEMVF